MLHILFVLLKILLFLLLSVLLLILLAVLIFLFVPVRYRMQLQKEENTAEKQDRLLDRLQAQIHVHWLLHLVYAVINIRGTDVKVRVTLLGYPVVGRKKPKKEKKFRKKQKTQPEERQDEESSDRPAGNILVEEDELNVQVGQTNAPVFIKEDLFEEQLREEPSFSEKDRTPEKTFFSAIVGFLKSIFAAAKDFCRQIQNSFRQTRDKLRDICKSYQNAKTAFDYYWRIWYDERTEKAKKLCLKEIRYVLSHYLPRMQKGRLIFGFDDPALTGQALGVFCALQGLTGGQLQIEADFERTRLEGNFVLKGHIRLCHLVKMALVLFWNKDIRATVKRIRKIQEKPEE